MLSCIFCKVIIFDESYFARFRCLCMTLVDVTTRQVFSSPCIHEKMNNNDFFWKETLSLYLEWKEDLNYMLKLQASEAAICRDVCRENKRDHREAVLEWGL